MDETPTKTEPQQATTPVLVLLARFPHGINEDLLVLAHGLDRTMIAGLIEEGLATARREIVTGPGRTTIEVVRISISDAGRRILEG
jgi:hypothetical protein